MYDKLINQMKKKDINKIKVIVIKVEIQLIKDLHIENLSLSVFDLLEKT